MGSRYYPMCYPGNQRQPSASFQYAALPACTTELAARAGARVAEVNAAFSNLKYGVIQRGIQYAGNTAASRGGFMAENFVAGSFNLDAVLKGLHMPLARVPGENGLASPDVLYPGGAASLKFYASPEASGKSQLNPGYGGQARIVPQDHLAEAKETLNTIADRNEMKGRTEVAAEQRAIAEKLTDRINSGGVESTPLTKQQDLAMAKAVRKGDDGKVTVDEAKIDQVMEDTGITGRVRMTKLRNELSGLGLAAAIGLGLGFTMTLLANLAQVGLDSGRIGDVLFDSLAAGAETGAISAVTFAAGRGASHLLQASGLNLLSSYGAMVNFAAVGLLSVSILCIYQLTKMKIEGVSDEEVLDFTGRAALSSVTMLAVSLAAKGIWGGPAGIIVSTGLGLVFLAVEAGKTVHARRLEQLIREHSIEEYKRAIDDRKLITSMI